MFKGFITGIIFTALAAAIAGYVIIRTGILPATADERPPRFEEWAAKTSLHATLRRSAPRVQNPLAETPQNLAAGIKLYAANCAVCHGAKNAEPTNVAKGLYQHPPQLGKDGVEDDPDGVIYWKIAHGLRWTGMPGFDRNLNETQMWQLTLFLKHMDALPPAAERLWSAVKA